MDGTAQTLGECGGVCGIPRKRMPNAPASAERYANARRVRRSLKEIARNQHRASGVQRRALPLPIKGSRTASK